MATFKTKLHHFHFDSSDHPGYKAMIDKIEANKEGRGCWMNSWGSRPYDYSEGNSTEEVELESTHLFSNQWNEADKPGSGRRLFDWYQEYTDLKFRRGHWLEITPEMAAARRETYKCGYCGAQYGPFHKPLPVGPFCLACLDSPYLKPTGLILLRLRPIIEPQADLPELTDAERAELMPLYVERQTTDSDSRAKKARDSERDDVQAKFAKASEAAIAERDGMMWLWNHGLSLSNVIYYSHTSTFSFGWHSPVSPEVRSKLLDLLSEFPFEYEIK